MTNKSKNHRDAGRQILRTLTAALLITGLGTTLTLAPAQAGKPTKTTDTTTTTNTTTTTPGSLPVDCEYGATAIWDAANGIWVCSSSSGVVAGTTPYAVFELNGQYAEVVSIDFGISRPVTGSGSTRQSGEASPSNISLVLALSGTQFDQAGFSGDELTLPTLAKLGATVDAYITGTGGSVAWDITLRGSHVTSITFGRSSGDTGKFILNVSLAYDRIEYQTGDSSYVVFDAATATTDTNCTIPILYDDWLAFSTGASISSRLSVTSSSTVNQSDVVLTLRSEGDAACFYGAVARGVPLDSVTVVAYGPNGTTFETTLANVYVTSVGLGGRSGQDVEAISVAFNSEKRTYNETF